MTSQQHKYQSYLKTEYWQRVAAAAKERAGHRCQVCNSEHRLEAHHRSYRHRGRELEHLDDITVLCHDCHSGFEERKRKNNPVVAVRVTSTPNKTQQWSRGIRWDEVERDMPPGGVVVLDKKRIAKLSTARGAYTAATVEALGLKFPLIGDWRRRLYGREVTAADYRDALIGRYIFKA